MNNVGEVGGYDYGVDAVEGPQGSSASYLGRHFSKIDPRNHATTRYIAQMISKNTSGFRSSAALVLKSAGGYTNSAVKALTTLKLVSALTLPFTIVDMIDGIKGVFREKEPLDKAESGLNATGDAAATVEGFAGLAVAGMAFHALCTGVKFTTPAWASTLGTVGLGFSVFSLVSQTSGLVRTYYCVHKMTGALNNKNLNSEQRVEKAIEFLQAKYAGNSKYLNKKFSIQYGSSVMKRLEEAQASKDKETAISEVKQELAYLKRRAWKVVGIKALKITGIAVVILGVGISMFTPYSYIGYALLIASVGLGIAAATAQYKLQRSGKKDPRKKMKIPLSPPVSTGSSKSSKPRRRIKDVSGTAGDFVKFVEVE